MGPVTTRLRSLVSTGSLMAAAASIALAVACLVLTVPGAQAKAGDDDRAMFQALYQRWTDAFNRKDLAGSCALFSPNLVADYRGVPRKNYATIKGGFEKTFARFNSNCKYSFKLHEIYRSGNLAAVRVTWYLTVTERGKPASSVTTQDEGLDVLEKGRDGRWQIVNFLGYERP